MIIPGDNMEEIITSILEAERRADDIVKNATDNAKNILIYAENNADEIREKAIVDFKAHRKDVLASAEKDAEALYYKKIAEGEGAAKELILSVEGKKTAAAEKILKKIIG